MGYTGSLAVLSLAVLAACATEKTTEGGVVGVERRQTMLVSSDTVNRRAAEEYRTTIQDAGAKGRLNRDTAQFDRVRGIANRLISGAAAFRPDSRSWNWDVNVIASNDVNAWCMPGGKIAVYTGLLTRLDPTDDELAAVLGHEISHALREHGRERYSQAIQQQIGITVVGALLGLGQTAINASQTFLDLTVGLPNSREEETEADRIGVELAARAGFDPRAAISLWLKMSRIGGDRPPQWLSTHPSNESRIQDLRAYSERVYPLYESARKR
jgi:predicted Zn-dependent protease